MDSELQNVLEHDFTVPRPYLEQVTSSVHHLQFLRGNSDQHGAVFVALGVAAGVQHLVKFVDRHLVGNQSEVLF